MPGHIFILRGDIRQLACDAWLLPCDYRAQAPRWIPPWVREKVQWPTPPDDFQSLRRRVLPAPTWAGDDRKGWLINVGYENRSRQTEEEFYRQSVTETLRRAFGEAASQSRPLHRREVPLVALPLLGGGYGMPMVELGKLLRFLLEIIQEELGRIEHRVDVALVTFGARSRAAAQHERKRVAGGAWADLGPEQRLQADALAQHAAAGKLALFIGAGTGIGAGLPTWKELLGMLADNAGVNEPLRSNLLDGHHHAIDQASYLQHYLGGPARLQQTVASIIQQTGKGYSLTHALLASLAVREATTTNYDTLFEEAWNWAEAEPCSGKPSYRLMASTSVIPHSLRPDASRWLLKLHGCITNPASIVLTRESYIRYSHQYAALEGILQAALLTRHMLFVGFSLKDDNFIRILDAVRRVVGYQTTSTESQHPFGSALMMGKDEVTQTLYRHDLRWIALSDRDELGMAGCDFQQPGRTQEIFLDYLLARTSGTSHLLDDGFSAILSEEQKQLRAALQPLVDYHGSATADSLGHEKVKAFLAEFGMPT